MPRYIANKNYIYRSIVGEDLLIPAGKEVIDHNGIVMLNESGALLWKEMQTEKTAEELCDALAEVYETERVDLEKDVREFVEYMRSIDAVEILE